MTHTEATKAKIRASMAGKKLTAEHRAKLSAAKKGKPQGPRTDPKYLAKIRRPVILMDALGNVYRYASLTLLREATGMAPTTVNRALRDGTSIKFGLYKGWTICDDE